MVPPKGSVTLGFVVRDDDAAAGGLICPAARGISFKTERLNPRANASQKKLHPLGNHKTFWLKCVALDHFISVIMSVCFYKSKHGGSRSIPRRTGWMGRAGYGEAGCADLAKSD
jgi:hypothetical protein